ncbi:B-cell receptor-associated protein 29 [Eleutherodactylus coqui]|uniref:Endoplasmic reticulum transmembrane protein n=1 Tax=Eleutherodactylus coqui TaxID=57060 RepID=A0A8J6KF78_ELECQ|nr:hypothetical protein GDO78_005772 [Eleutherodactylus coqui]
MTFQWTAVALFLYGEVGVILIFCIPFISPSRWKKIFRYQLWSKISSYWNKAFLSIIVILIVLFLDAVREVRKYSVNSEVDKSAKLYASTYDHLHMKLFRAQRNLYISGFSLFLWLVLRRVTNLIVQLATETESCDALKAQVEKNNEAAKKYMEDNEHLKKVLDSSKANDKEQKLKRENETLQHEIEKGKEELRRMAESLSKSQAEVLALKKQSEGLTREYDRLITEHELLQNTILEQDSKKEQ